MKEAAWQALSDPTALQTKFAGALERGDAFSIDVPQGPVGEKDTNMIAADRELKLTPEEKALYERHLENLYGPGGVDNPDGSRSTLFNITVNRDDRTYVLPTVYDGQILSPGDAIRRAEAIGFDRFPSYSNEDEASSRYQKMHDYMERDTKQYLNERGNK